MIPINPKKTLLKSKAVQQRHVADLLNWSLKIILKRKIYLTIKIKRKLSELEQVHSRYGQVQL